MSRLSFKILLILLLFSIAGFGQVGDVKITLKVDKDTVNIGDIVHIESKVWYGKMLTLSGDGLRGLPENEYLEFLTDPVSSKGETLDENRHMVNLTLKDEVDALVFLDSGWIELPPVVYSVVMNDTTYSYESNPVKFFVAPVIEQQDIPKGLRTIIEEPKKWSDYWPLFLGIALVGLAIGLYYFLRKRTKEEPEEPKKIEPVIPPGEEALSALESLYKSKRWEQEPKEAQVQLSQILRRYIEREYRIPALEETTREIERDLRQISPHQRAMLVRLLNESDLVKFAKMTMPNERQSQSIKEAILWVKSNTNG